MAVLTRGTTGTSANPTNRFPGRAWLRSSWTALAGYLLLAIAGTWPLTRGIARNVAWDLGDSMLVMWVLSWDAEQMLGLLRGELTRAATFFDANIFHPVPLALAYSEHFVAQAVQYLPIYALTGNPILGYNLLYLSTFVLSGLGMFLFVRELTGKAAAAFVAGVLFAFAPYRLPQSPHLHVLSSQWMPFVLYGLHRYFAAVADGRRAVRPLAGATAALVAQNLSSGYYLLYFGPVAAIAALWEIWRRRLWRRAAMWGQLAIAAVAVVALTAPFFLPYLEVAEQLQVTRSRSELVRYSADVHSFATASGETLWGDAIRAFPKPEGDLFFGLTPLVLAVIGVAAWWTGRLRRHGAPDDMAPAVSAGTESARASSEHPSGLPGIPARRWWQHPVVVRLLVAALAAHAVAAVLGLINRRVVVDLWIAELQISNVNQMLVRAALAGVLLLVVSPSIRARARAFAAGPGFFLAALLMAMWLALGPVPLSQGRPLEIAAPYALLYEYVPGFDGIRVPARLGMIAVLMLSVLGGYGAAALAAGRRSTVVVLSIACAGMLAESLVLPFPVNRVTPTPGYAEPEARLYRPARAPGVYHAVAQQAPQGIVAELPLGESDFDARAMFYSIVHWRPLLNGYSGLYPRHYGSLARALSDVPRFPEVALDALHTQGATHVVVHENAYLDGRGAATTRTLIERGAIELFRDGGDVLVQLP